MFSFPADEKIIKYFYFYTTNYNKIRHIKLKEKIKKMNDVQIINYILQEMKMPLLKQKISMKICVIPLPIIFYITGKILKNA